jgi:hypothetical protein
MVAIVLASAGAQAQASSKASCFDAAEQAQLLRDRGDLVGARPGLITCASQVCPAVVRHDCLTWLAQVDAATPSLTFHARDSRGHDVIGVRVLIDGALVAEKLGGKAIAANPGAHRIRFETASGAAHEEQVLVTEGQKERLVDVSFTVELEADGKPPPSGAEAAPSPTTPNHSAGASGSDGVQRGSSRTWLVAGFGATAVLGLGLSTYFEIAGQNEYSSLKNNCGMSASCQQSDVDSSKQKLYVLAPVTFGLGVISLGVAAAVLLLGHDAPRASAVWRLDVLPTAGTGAAASFAAQY